MQLRKPFPRAKHQPLAWSQSSSAQCVMGLEHRVLRGLRAAVLGVCWRSVSRGVLQQSSLSFYQSSPVLIASVAEVLPEQQVFKPHIIYDSFLGVT